MDGTPVTPEGTADTADLVEALRRLLDADEGGDPFDNARLATALGWDLPRTSRCLEVAKEGSLIWGARGPHKPGPWFSEIEVTVQGRRYLRAHA